MIQHDYNQEQKIDIYELQRIQHDINDMDVIIKNCLDKSEFNAIEAILAFIIYYPSLLYSLMCLGFLSLYFLNPESVHFSKILNSLFFSGPLAITSLFFIKKYEKYKVKKIKRQFNFSNIIQRKETLEKIIQNHQDMIFNEPILFSHLKILDDIQENYTNKYTENFIHHYDEHTTCNFKYLKNTMLEAYEIKNSGLFLSTIEKINDLPQALDAMVPTYLNDKNLLIDKYEKFIGDNYIKNQL